LPRNVNLNSVLSYFSNTHSWRLHEEKTNHSIQVQFGLFTVNKNWTYAVWKGRSFFISSSFDSRSAWNKNRSYYLPYTRAVEVINISTFSFPSFSTALWISVVFFFRSSISDDSASCTLWMRNRKTYVAQHKISTTTPS
jgi:hypothetical protein